MAYTSDKDLKKVAGEALEDQKKKRNKKKKKPALPPLQDEETKPSDKEKK